MRGAAIKLLWGLVAALSVSGVASAAVGRYHYTITYTVNGVVQTSGNSYDRMEACTQHATFKTANSSWRYEATGTRFPEPADPVPGSTYAWYCDMTFYDKSTGAAAGTSDDPGKATYEESDDVCDQYLGVQMSGFVTEAPEPKANPGDEVKNVEGCGFRVIRRDICVGDAMCLYTVEGTGDPFSGAPEVEPLDQQQPNSQNQHCAIGESGREVCIDANGSGNGTESGNPYGPTTPEPDSCQYYSDGNYICSGSPPPDQQPVDPWTQQPAPVEQEWDTQTGGGGTTIINNNYYGGGGSAPSGPPTDGNQEEPGTCSDDPATSSNECGNLVKIDESGTPTGEEDMFDAEVDETGIDGHIADVQSGAETAVPETTIGGNDFLLPAGGACQNITLEIWDRTLVVPGPEGCSWLAKLKEGLKWALYALTVLMLFQIVTTPIKT